MSSTKAELRGLILTAIAPLIAIAQGDPGALPLPCAAQPGNSAQGYVRHQEREAALLVVVPGTVLRTRTAKGSWQVDATATLMLYAPAGREDLDTLDKLDETIEMLSAAVRRRGACPPWEVVDGAEDPDFEDAALHQMRAGVKFAVLTFRATEND